jgi:hypothetical protein
LGDNARLVSTNTGTTLSLAPATLSLGLGARIVNTANTWIIGGATDPFTDSTQPTRHLDVYMTNTSNSATGTLNISTGSKQIGQLVARTTVVNQGAALTVDNIQSTTSVSLNGTLSLRPGGKGTNIVGPLILGGTTNAWTATFDVADQNVIFQYTTLAAKSTAMVNILNQLKSGYHNGDWQGVGITSSTVAADASATGGHMTGLALYDNAFLGLATFGTQLIDENSLLITTALPGDTNLDNIVNDADYAAVTSHWQSAQNSWSAGDLNYDGFVDILDATIVAQHWMQTFNPATSGVTPAMPFSDPGTIPVPEPASALLGVPALMLLLRRRIRHFPGHPL